MSIPGPISYEQACGLMQNKGGCRDCLWLMVVRYWPVALTDTPYHLSDRIHSNPPVGHRASFTPYPLQPSLLARCASCTHSAVHPCYRHESVNSARYFVPPGLCLGCSLLSTHFAHLTSSPLNFCSKAELEHLLWKVFPDVL